MLTLKEEGFVLHDIIDTLAKDTQLPVNILIDLVAKETDRDRKHMIKALKAFNSCFTANNAIVGYIGDKPNKRTAIFCSADKILKKMKTKLYPALDDDEYPDDAKGQDLDTVFACMQTWVIDGILADSVTMKEIKELNA